MAGAWDLKPGSATLPFFGVQPVLLDQEGREKDGATEGNLCIRAPWPGECKGWDHFRDVIKLRPFPKSDRSRNVIVLEM
jgi:acyl-coenzyme A synthetase/AMP-(fatty) acid ligase